MESLAFWKIKSEAQIQRGIGMFVVNLKATAETVADVAMAGPPNGESLPGNLKLSRADEATVGQGVICYVGVQGWLVKSGVVSMRWFMQNSAPNKEVGCDLVFGKGVEKWNAKLTDTDKPRVKQIIAGFPRVPSSHLQPAELQLERALGHLQRRWHDQRREQRRIRDPRSRARRGGSEELHPAQHLAGAVLVLRRRGREQGQENGGDGRHRSDADAQSHLTPFGPATSRFVVRGHPLASQPLL